VTVPPCFCPTRDGQRLARVPWSTATRPGCPQHPPGLCTAVHRRLSSSSTHEPVDTVCNTRLVDGGCPNGDHHA
jgi:hypothetical protein